MRYLSATLLCALCLCYLQFKSVWALPTDNLQTNSDTSLSDKPEKVNETNEAERNGGEEGEKKLEEEEKDGEEVKKSEVEEGEGGDGKEGKEGVKIEKKSEKRTDWEENEGVVKKGDDGKTEEDGGGKRKGGERVERRGKGKKKEVEVEKVPNATVTPAMSSDRRNAYKSIAERRRYFNRTRQISRTTETTAKQQTSTPVYNDVLMPAETTNRPHNVRTNEIATESGRREFEFGRKLGRRRKLWRGKESQEGKEVMSTKLERVEKGFWSTTERGLESEMDNFVMPRLTTSKLDSIRWNGSNRTAPYRVPNEPIASSNRTTTSRSIIDVLTTTEEAIVFNRTSPDRLSHLKTANLTDEEEPLPLSLNSEEEETEKIQSAVYGQEIYRVPQARRTSKETTIIPKTTKLTSVTEETTARSSTVAVPANQTAEPPLPSNHSLEPTTHVTETLTNHETVPQTLTNESLVPQTNHSPESPNPTNQTAFSTTTVRVPDTRSSTVSIYTRKVGGATNKTTETPGRTFSSTISTTPLQKSTELTPKTTTQQISTKKHNQNQTDSANKIVTKPLTPTTSRTTIRGNYSRSTISKNVPISTLVPRNTSKPSVFTTLAPTSAVSVPFSTTRSSVVTTERTRKKLPSSTTWSAGDVQTTDYPRTIEINENNKRVLNEMFRTSTGSNTAKVEEITALKSHTSESPSTRNEEEDADLAEEGEYHKSDGSSYSTKFYIVPNATRDEVFRVSEHDEFETVSVALYVLAVFGLLPVVLALVFAARFVIRRRRFKPDIEADRISDLSVRPTHLHKSPSNVTTTTMVGVSRGRGGAAEEVDRDNLNMLHVLGQGNFGQVWKAELRTELGGCKVVAVKTVKEGAKMTQQQELIKELCIMRRIGEHPNVVTLLGCCTEQEPYYLVMEYVARGKLLTFLREHRNAENYYNFSSDSQALTSRDLTVFAFCVARGMEYLASKAIIHRDLAARNVLVDHNKLCKIADFGMSRIVRQEDEGQIYEERQHKGALPIRWMAPESLLYSVFTHKSDVWSYGILLWEIVTLGSTPYPNMGAREVVRRVQQGYRLERPSHCTSELHQLMTSCWHQEPSDRPDCAELSAHLARLLDDAQREGNYVDLSSFAMDTRYQCSTLGWEQWPERLRKTRSKRNKIGTVTLTGNGSFTVNSRVLDRFSLL